MACTSIPFSAKSQRNTIGARSILHIQWVYITPEGHRPGKSITFRLSNRKPAFGSKRWYYLISQSCLPQIQSWNMVHFKKVVKPCNLGIHVVKDALGLWQIISPNTYISHFPKSHKFILLLLWKCKSSKKRKKKKKTWSRKLHRWSKSCINFV